MATFGGQMTCKLTDGTVIRIRGDFTRRPSNITAATITNQDGTIDKTVTPRPYGFGLTAVNDGQNWNKLLLETGINATVINETTGKTELFSNGQFTGEPEIANDGAVTGLTFDSTHYRVV